MHAIKQQSAFNLCYNLEEMIMQQVFHKGHSKECLFQKPMSTTSLMEVVTYLRVLKKLL